ncbi:MAG: Xylose isomerase-like barrel [Phycisphaerales bacterium]|jgi:sugar phosphate isomerase/epimerase|nr:Xylose isomerase-like barrel [Phycisphaerales bacterium]
MNSESIQIGITAAALSDDPRQAPALARSLGFKGIQFDAYSNSFSIPDLAGSGRREFRHVLSSQDQELVGLRGELGARGLGPGADVDRILSKFAKALEAATDLASPLFCVDLGPLPAPAVTEAPKPKVTAELAGMILLPTTPAAPAPVAPAAPPPDPAVVSQVDAALSEIGRLADRYSVVVAFRSDLASLAALERAVAQAACPWFGIDFDPVAVLRDEWNMDETFSRLGALVRHVRGRDAVKGADRRTRPAVVGQGDTDWGSLLANLDAADYRGWITIDPTELPDRNAAAVAGRKHIAKF